MDRPVLMAVDDDPGALRPVEDELRKRYGADYDVRCLTSPEAALRELAAIRTDGGEVALVLADQWMPGMTGIEFLDRVGELHPEAQRAVLIDWNDQTGPVLPVAMLRQIDWITKPWRPGDEHFHQAVAPIPATGGRCRIARGSWPLGWWASAGRRGRTSSATCSAATACLSTSSSRDPDGRRSGPGAARSRAGGVRLPVVVLFDGRVLSDPPARRSPRRSGFGPPAGIRQPYDVTVVGAGSGRAGRGGLRRVRGAAYRGAGGRRRSAGRPARSSMIRNYLGFPRGISGADLAQRAYEQAWLLGAEFVYGPRAVGLPRRRRRSSPCSDGARSPAAPSSSPPA